MDSFTIGLTIGPSGIHSLGITKGDWREGSEFVHRAAPIIAEFSERFVKLYKTSGAAKKLDVDLQNAGERENEK